MNKVLLRDKCGYHVASSKIDVPQNELSIGSLHYTLSGLILTIGWICLSWFGYALVGLQVANFLPVQLRDHGGSNTLIAILVTTIPYLLNMVITPVVSFLSDRKRSPRGRRMPYIYTSTPFVALFLLLIGWAVPLATKIAVIVPISGDKLAIGLIALAAIGYQIANLYIGSIIYYLFPDVIPSKTLGRFMSVIQLVGSFCTFFFSYFLLSLGGSHLPWLYTWIALAFLVSMLMMTVLVKEGEYPPAKGGDVKISVIASIKLYLKECYGVPYYYGLFIMLALSEVSMVCRSMFNLLYAKESLHLTLSEFGVIMGWGSIVGIVLSIPSGMLVDRFHALRVYAAGLALVVVVNIISFFWVSDYFSFMISTLLLAVVYTIQMTSTIPAMVAVLPAANFGQLCSANAMLRAVFMAVGGFGGGLLLDWLKNYQYIYAWDFIFTFAALIAWLVLFKSWKQRGTTAFVVQNQEEQI